MVSFYYICWYFAMISECQNFVLRVYCVIVCCYGMHDVQDHTLMFHLGTTIKAPGLFTFMDH